MVSQVTRTAPTCVWVQAGLLSYRLCQRNFDCEHCPLDAALRGKAAPCDSSGNGAATLPTHPVSFPHDRVYSSGHAWLQRRGEQGSRIRLGLDGFVASFLPTPLNLRWTLASGLAERGTEVCEIDFGSGMLPITLPVSARIEATNPALEADPALLVSAPYSDGWMVELSLLAAGQLDELLPPETAEQHARLDSRLLRRRIAMQLLLDTEDEGSLDLAVRTDIRRLLGERRFLGLLRELVCPEC